MQHFKIKLIQIFLKIIVEQPWIVYYWYYWNYWRENEEFLRNSDRKSQYSAVANCQFLDKLYFCNNIRLFWKLLWSILECCFTGLQLTYGVNTKNFPKNVFWNPVQYNKYQFLNELHFLKATQNFSEKLCCASWQPACCSGSLMCKLVISQKHYFEIQYKDRLFSLLLPLCKAVEAFCGCFVCKGPSTNDTPLQTGVL